MAAYGFQGFSIENPYEPKKAKAPIPGAPAVPADTPIGPAPGQPAQGGGAKSAAPPRPAGSTFTPPRVGGQEGTMGQAGGGLPYGTGDNRRQAGQMPLKGAVGAPPAGGFRRATWGNANSGSAGQGNMPGPGGGPGGWTGPGVNIGPGGGFQGGTGVGNPYTGQPGGGTGPKDAPGNNLQGPGGRSDLGWGSGNVRPGGGQRTIAPMPTGPVQPTPARGVNVGPGGAPVDQPTTTMPAAPAGMPNWWKPQPVSPGTGMQGGGPAIANPYEQPRRAAAPQQDGGGSTGVAPATPAPRPEGGSEQRRVPPSGGDSGFTPGRGVPGGPGGGGISV